MTFLGQSSGVSSDGAAVGNDDGTRLGVALGTELGALDGARLGTVLGDEQVGKKRLIAKV